MLNILAGSALLITAGISPDPQLASEASDAVEQAFNTSIIGLDDFPDHQVHVSDLHVEGENVCGSFSVGIPFQGTTGWFGRYVFVATQTEAGEFGYIQLNTAPEVHLAACPGLAEYGWGTRHMPYQGMAVHTAVLSSLENS